MAFLAAVAAAANLNPTHAAAPPGLNRRAESSNSGDDASAESLGSGDDAPSVISMIKSIDDKKAVVAFLKSLSHTNHDSMDGCVKANNNTDLATLINESVDGDEIHLCPGVVDFDNEIEIELSKSITIICAGPKAASCIFDGHEATGHFFITGSGFTLAFVGLVFINGLTGFGGSLNLSGITSIFNNCVFYNNRAILVSISIWIFEYKV